MQFLENALFAVKPIKYMYSRKYVLEQFERHLWKVQFLSWDSPKQQFNIKRRFKSNSSNTFEKHDF